MGSSVEISPAVGTSVEIPCAVGASLLVAPAEESSTGCSGRGSSGGGLQVAFRGRFLAFFYCEVIENRSVGKLNN